MCCTLSFRVYVDTRNWCYYYYYYYYYYYHHLYVRYLQLYT